MQTILLFIIAVILLGLTYVVSAAITRKQLEREKVDQRQDLIDIRNYVLDVSTETAFVRARFDPPVSIHLPADEQIRIGFQNMVNVDWNAAFALLYGYPADYDMSKVSLGQRISMSDPRNLDFVRDFVANNYSAIGHDMMGTRVSGEPIAILASTSGIVENDHLVGLWGTMINKTALMNAESELQKSKELFTKAFQLSPDAMVISKIAGGEIIDINDGFTALTGYRRDEVVGSSTIGLGLWKDPSQRQQAIDRLSAEGTVRDLQAAFVTKSGETVDCLTSADCMVIDSENYLLSTTRAIAKRELLLEVG